MLINIFLNFTFQVIPPLSCFSAFTFYSFFACSILALTSCQFAVRLSSQSCGFEALAEKGLHLSLATETF